MKRGDTVRIRGRVTRYIVRQRIDNAVINTALSNSFGFGGTNASLVFQRLEK